MDRPGVGQVQEGSGEQRKLEETGCEVICGAPTTAAVKGLVKVKAVNRSSFIFCSLAVELKAVEPGGETRGGGR